MLDPKSSLGKPLLFVILIALGGALLVFVVRPRSVPGSETSSISKTSSIPSPNKAAIPQVSGGRLVVELAEVRPGLEFQLYFDRGNGMSEEESVKGIVSDDRVLSMVLPAGDYRGLRLDPPAPAASLRIVDARIENASGGLVRNIAPSDFQSGVETAVHDAPNGAVRVDIAPGASDPQIPIRVDTAIRVR